mmetsp:Transcript_80396/g.208932  ORF Transcript_80396/g.208932 Transcript_80396/m.208932 type:complete len:263 (-) Transcript_80396:110-898(-)
MEPQSEAAAPRAAAARPARPPDLDGGVVKEAGSGGTPLGKRAALGRSGKASPPPLLPMPPSLTTPEIPSEGNALAATTTAGTAACVVKVLSTPPFSPASLLSSPADEGTGGAVDAKGAAASAPEGDDAGVGAGLPAALGGPEPMLGRPTAFLSKLPMLASTGVRTCFGTTTPSSSSSTMRTASPSSSSGGRNNASSSRSASDGPASEEPLPLAGLPKPAGGCWVETAARRRSSKSCRWAETPPLRTLALPGVPAAFSCFNTP